MLQDLTIDLWSLVIITPFISMLAFQLDGVFIGATLAKEMRNSMILSSLIFYLIIEFIIQDALNLKNLYSTKFKFQLKTKASSKNSLFVNVKTELSKKYCSETFMKMYVFCDTHESNVTKKLNFASSYFSDRSLMPKTHFKVIKSFRIR